MKKRKNILVLGLFIYISLLNGYSQGENCPIFVDIQQTIDSIQEEIGQEEKLIFSIQYLDVENESNYSFALTINRSLDALILSDINYYILYRESFIIINNFSTASINGDIDNFFCGTNILDSSITNFIEHNFNTIERKRLPYNIDLIYNFRKINGVLIRKNTPRWIRN